MPSAIRNHLAHGVESMIFPGAVLLVADGAEIVCFEAVGQSDPEKSVDMTRATIFDLASLTKPLATTLAVMLMAQEGRLALADTVAQHLPNFAGTDKADLTVEQLLLHISGLTAHRPFYLTLGGLPARLRKKTIMQMIADLPLENRPGKVVQYSDLGFMLLGWMVESVSGMRLDRFVINRIYTTLEIEDLFFVDLAIESRPEAPFAVTEHCPWRKKVLKGEVHDDNAYAMGGIAGHAGLFGNAVAVHRLVWALLSAYYGIAQKGIFLPEWVRRFLTPHKRHRRTFGFDLPAEQNAACGRYVGMPTIGHLGFTGTSFWADLTTKRTVVLLTNRVYPSRDNDRIRAYRPQLHNLIHETIAWPSFLL